MALARHLETFFLQKRLLIHSHRPECILREESNELRQELVRKDELIRSVEKNDRGHVHMTLPPPYQYLIHAPSLPFGHNLANPLPPPQLRRLMYIVPYQNNQVSYLGN